MFEKNEILGIRLKVLILEDSRFDLELIKELLTDAGYILDLTHVDNESGFRSSLLHHKYDIILSDFNLPGFDAFGSLAIRNELCPQVPFICISGSIGEVTAIDLLKQGADDYVLKDRPERLPFAVKRALDEAKENAALLKSAKELQESKLRFEQVADDAQEWIWEVDTNGLYTYTSSVVKHLLGYSSDELVGKKHFFDFFAPDFKQELKDGAFDVFSRRESFRHFQNPTIHRDGHIVILSTSGSPIFDDKGVLVGYRGVDTDITERTKMVEELVQAKERAEESDKLKTAFINNISHEIRTPLNSIIGFGQFLVDSDLSIDERREYFNIIQKSSNRLMNAVSDYIDYARIVSGTMEVNRKLFQIQPFFNEIIEEVKLTCENKGISFKSEIPLDKVFPMLNTDSEFIRKIVQILIGNAIKFSTEGSIHFGYLVIPGFIEFYVNDSGCGIAPDKLDKIFQMFYQEDLSITRGHEGSGLGLTIAKGLVELLGGVLRVTSEKGKGSNFTFTIPYVDISQSTNASKTKKTSSTEKNKPLILIAEDEESNFLYLKVLMKQIGCEYIRANNGAEAVEQCRLLNNISLVLMDIKMPVMNGLEATQFIHKFRPDLPIIATTAYAQTGDENRFLSAGCNGYLAKPLKKNDLMALIQKYI